MSGPNDPGAPHRLQARGQGGYTLVEILVALAISVLLIGPVGAWMILAMETQGPTATRFSEASQARIANTYLSRDVGSAELVRTEGFGSDPGCGTDAGDDVFLQLVDDPGDGIAVPIRTVYVTNVDDGLASVWRRTCRVSDTTVVEDQVHLLRGVDMSTGNEPDAVCAPASETECRQVSFSATLEEGGAEVDVRATRRSTLDPSFVGNGGNFVPTARITEVSLGGVRPNFRAVLDSSDSSDLDGSIQSQTWTAAGPGPVTIDDPGAVQTAFTFSVPGTYTVTLEVSDGTDSAADTYEVEVANLAPVPKATVSPAEGPVQGGGLAADFAFDATASFDPEGEGPLSYSWDFGDGVASTSTTTGPTPQVQFLATATLGTREVKLTVADPLGATAVERISIRLLAADGSDPEPTGPIQIATDGEPPSGELVNTTDKSPRAGTVGAGRPDVTVDFSTTTPGSLTWELRRGATVVVTNTDPSFSHSFGPSDAGEWTIALTPDGGTTETRDFRLNGAPVAAFSSTGSGSAPSSRTYSSGGSSDDSEIVSYEWDFGFFDNWKSSLANPTHLFTHPGSYTVTLVVTDDDGAKSSKVGATAIAGTLDPPPAGSFEGNEYSWAAVPGAEDYEVHLEVGAATGCTSSTGPYDYTVAVSAAPTFSTAYANCAVTAKHRLKVSGTWSPYSTTVARP